MPTVREIASWMDALAPLSLSESWDNTGLLLGDPSKHVLRLQTCLTLTPISVAEAVDARADMVIAHHPLPFKPLGRITTETVPGSLVWQLCNAGISVYSPHTAWDSCETGINARLGEFLDLRSVEAIVLPSRSQASAGLTRSAADPVGDAGGRIVGAGRIGNLSEAKGISEVAEVLRAKIADCRCRGVDSGRLVKRIAIACGSGGSLLPAAIAKGCDLFITGEATFHQCLEAESAGVGLLMLGHFASERFAMLELSGLLQAAFPALEVWGSKKESDPVRNFS